MPATLAIGMGPTNVLPGMPAELVEVRAEGLGLVAALDRGCGLPAPPAYNRCMASGWRARIGAVRRDAYALYLASRDPRVPWYARLLVAAVVAYALSPIDLIPDFIPVIGYLDDIVLIPLGILAARALIPADVFEEHRRTAASREGAPGLRAGAYIVIATWVVTAAVGVAVAAWLVAA